MARRKFKNELSTLPAYRRLIDEIASIAQVASTQELRRRAGLESDKRGTLGALWMLEVTGRAYATRGSGNQFCWNPGSAQRREAI